MILSPVVYGISDPVYGVYDPLVYPSIIVPSSDDLFNIQLDEINHQLFLEELRLMHSNAVRYNQAKRYLNDANNLFSDSAREQKNALSSLSTHVENILNKNELKNPIPCKVKINNVEHDGFLIGIDNTPSVIVQVGDKRYSIKTKENSIQFGGKTSSSSSSNSSSSSSLSNKNTTSEKSTLSSDNSSSYISTSHLSPFGHKGGKNDSDSIFLKAGAQDKIGIISSKSKYSNYFSQTTSIIDGLCE